MQSVQPRSAVEPGRSRPLGANWDGKGTNFAVASVDATSIDVCLFDEQDSAPAESISLPSYTDGVWHGYVEGIGPGQRYGLRAHGPYNAELGQRFNSSMLLLDPYAYALTGQVSWGPELYAYDLTDPDDELAINHSTNDTSMPKCVVIDTSFDWGDDAPPQIPMHETIFYEVHVKGATKLHPDVPTEDRGSYRGLPHPAMLAHFRHLGVTSIELLPVHAHVDEPFLQDRGLTNYWGYSTVGFFAPEGSYSASGDLGSQVVEFKSMVKALHAAGLEVILDVVYNHTCEGNQLGPSLTLRGLDNRYYYRLLPGKPEYYLDFTGTGNSLDVTQQVVLNLVMDSLRYWVTEMHVDGFRFDLAVTLGRESYDFDPTGSFFKALRQDPILAEVKLIAEPWDVGEGGYQVGNFPSPWSEWNDKFRDSVRAFWQADSNDIGEMGYRLSGSSDLYHGNHRNSDASVNLITAHDGHTLADLVSYVDKHNEANLEKNHDGHDHNLSNNYGTEGATEDRVICALRSRQQRNMLATLLLSRGVPLLLGGDEMNRTQQGNNNAYCQDNVISWLNWDHTAADQELIDFVHRTLELRKTNPVLRQFYEATNQMRDEPTTAMSWWRPDGGEMELDDWSTQSSTIALRLELVGESESGTSASGDGPVLLVIHAGHDPLDFVPPLKDHEGDKQWRVLLDTEPRLDAPQKSHAPDSVICIPGRSVLLMQSTPVPN